MNPIPKTTTKGGLKERIVGTLTFPLFLRILGVSGHFNCDCKYGKVKDSFIKGLLGFKVREVSRNPLIFIRNTNKGTTPPSLTKGTIKNVAVNLTHLRFLNNFLKGVTTADSACDAIDGGEWELDWNFQHELILIKEILGYINEASNFDSDWNSISSPRHMESWTVA